jgi:MerR family copper efflux transcriptional regulator
MNIGMASHASGVSQRMIRHYEKIGLITAPARRDSGYRDYSEAEVHTLRFIANARDLGFPIAEIQELLALWVDPSRSRAEVRALATARADDMGRKADALQAMRQTLLELAKCCLGEERPDCPILEELSAPGGIRPDTGGQGSRRPRRR